MATSDISQVASGVTQYIPSANSLLGFFAWFLGILLVAGICGFFVWRTWRKRQFPEQLVLWKEINGQSAPFQTFKSGKRSVSRSGDQLYRTNKGKWLPVPKLYVRPGLVYYFEGKDGEWINFIVTSIDKKRKEMGTFFVHEDMRLGRINVGDILDKQLTKKSWWDKWKDTIVTIIFILIATIALVILFSKIVDVTKALNGYAGGIKDLSTSLADTSQKVGDLAESVRGLSDYVQGKSGTGLVVKGALNGTT